MTTLQHAVLTLPQLGNPGPHHAIGVAEGFGLLVLVFGTALGLMMTVGHLRHRRRD